LLIYFLTNMDIYYGLWIAGVNAGGRRCAGDGWLRGQAVLVTAYVIGPGLCHSETTPAPTPLVRFLINRLRRLSKLTGANFAILDRHAAQDIHLDFVHMSSIVTALSRIRTGTTGTRKRAA
jgi:hypothetical protein